MPEKLKEFRDYLEDDENWDVRVNDMMRAFRNERGFVCSTILEKLKLLLEEYADD